MKYELRTLNTSFYAKYPEAEYSEILVKDSRPYAVIIVEILDNNWAIPLRSNVRHNYCYKLKTSTRSYRAALDFTKAVVIDLSTDLDSTASINNQEFIDIDSKIDFIISKFTTFINNYAKMCIDETYNSYERELIDKFGTLKYFKQLITNQ